jgi:hypothetical protein
MIKSASIFIIVLSFVLMGCGSGESTQVVPVKPADTAKAPAPAAGNPAIPDNAKAGAMGAVPNTGLAPGENK